MAEQDYYQVLGIDRDAGEEQIKKAYRKIAMKCHPDRQNGKSDEEKAQASQRFELAREASEVLSNPTYRSAYDRGGVQAVQKLKNAAANGGYGGSTARGMTEEEAGFNRKPMSVNDLENFFGVDTDDNQTTERRPRKTAEERRAARNARRGIKTGHTSAPATKQDDNSAGASFNDVSQSMRQTTDKMRQIQENAKNITLPVQELNDLKDALDDMGQEVDRLIRIAKKNTPSR